MTTICCCCLQDCCSSVESYAAIGQALPTTKEDLDTLILREIPRIQVQIGDTIYDIASPGKAFENSKQKMVCEEPCCVVVINNADFVSVNSLQVYALFARPT